MGEPVIQHRARQRTEPSSSAHLRPVHESPAPPPLSPSLAPALAVTGGILAALGALGTWVRAGIVGAGGSDPTFVDAVVGRSEGGGWTLVVVGVAAAVAGAGWSASRRELRRAAAVGSVLVVAFAAGTLISIDRRAAELAGGAGSDPSFASYHAGFGWGAWLLLVAVILAALGLLAGGLRGLDLRRGA